MKKPAILAVTIFLFCSFQVQAHRALAADGLTRITDSVYSYVDVKNSSPQNSFGANAGIVIGTDGILVIDTLVSSKEAQRFIRDIRKISDKPIRFVVNTHYHLDHSFGNEDFRKLGAVIISHAVDGKYMTERNETVLENAKDYGLTGLDIEGTVIACPTLSFTDRMEIDLGNQRVVLIHAGASHTDGSILVHLPAQKLLFAGDALFTGYHPFMADGNLDEWIGTLDYIAALAVDTIIPGHGPVSTKEDVADMKNYLISFDKSAKELSAGSNDPDFIFSELRKALPSRPKAEWLIRANIVMKYLKKNE